MGLFVSRVLSFALLALGWVLAGVRWVLDLIGYSTAPNDAAVARGLLEQFLVWLMSLPWWLPWGFAFASTMWLIWVSWPRQRAVAAGSPEESVNKKAADESQRPTSTPEQDDSGAVAEEADVIPFADRLYVGQHYAFKEKLEAEHIFGLTFLCFNGNEGGIVIAGINGTIVFRSGDSPRTLDERILSAPAFPTSIEAGVERPGLSEFIIAVEQRVESDLAKTMTETIESVEHAYLDLSGLNIFVAPAENQGERVKLTIPNTVRLFNKDDRFFVLGRVSSLSANVTVGR